MLTIRHILFPTDYSPCADRAFGHAVFLAERHGARLHVFHVAPVDGPEATPPTYPVPDSVERVDVSERSRSVPAPILAYAEAVDLVVMGTHGRRGLRRVAVGSTTEQVMRHAECPVLAVGPGAAQTAPSEIRRILVPVDFSDSSGPALAVADELAALYGARVDALHAAFVPDLPDVYEFGLLFDGSYPDVVARAGDALRSLVGRFVSAEHRGEVVVRVGPPAPTILAEAEALGAGLLVMPTHGRTGLERLAFGSVAEGVLRRAPCPVLALTSYGRIPLPAASGAPRPVPRPSLELADVLANHDV